MSLKLLNFSANVKKTYLTKSRLFGLRAGFFGDFPNSAFFEEKWLFSGNCPLRYLS